LKIPARRAECSLTENAGCPFQAEPEQVRLSQLSVSLPPPAEQRAIVETLACQMGEARRLIAVLESEVEGIERLPATLLRQAFSGSL